MLLRSLVLCVVTFASVCQGFTCYNGSLTTQADYRGYKNTTINRRQCQNWTSQSPQTHEVTATRFPNAGIGDHNYCRNPTNDTAGLWCYTTDPDVRLEPCGLRSCTGYTCYNGSLTTQADYRGYKNMTINGRQCQKWTSQTPHTHTVTPTRYPNAGLGDHNFCRNPIGDPVRGAWCYTIDPDVTWELCNPPVCANKSYTIQAVNGFLKKVDKDENDTYHCWNSTVKYTLSNDVGSFAGMIKGMCVPDYDPGFYQSCGLVPTEHGSNIKPGESHWLCSNIVCRQDFREGYFGVSIAYCPTYWKTKPWDWCTDVPDAAVVQYCDERDLERCGKGYNEVGCNATYGMEFLYKLHHSRYWLPPQAIFCDSTEWKIALGTIVGYIDGQKLYAEVCGPHNYEGKCTTNMKLNYDKDGIGSIDHNSIRFDRTEPYERNYYKRQRCVPTKANIEEAICLDGNDRINCTNSNIVFNCTHNETSNNTITLTDSVLCGGFPLCKDNVTNKCENPEKDCRIHRHFVCDGEKDCADGMDEDQAACDEKRTYITCIRTVHNLTSIKQEEPYILKDWVMDGVKDCENGKDEDRTFWKECKYEGVNESLWIEPKESCDTLFYCKDEGKLLERKDMCNGIRKNDCQVEKFLCKIAREKNETIKARASLDSEAQKYIGPCSSDTSTNTCSEYILEQSYGTEQISITAPKTRSLDCSDLFGEGYVYATCLGLCKNTSIQCPLVPHHFSLSCPHLDNRIMTLTHDNRLTFVKETTINNKSAFINREVFSCSNGNCVPYSNVCDLIDDCGDFSDEANCHNHFKCANDTNEIISLARVCNGVIDCSNSADECNVNCSSQNDKHIIHTTALTVWAWTIGISATAINGFVFTRNIKEVVFKKDFTTANLFATALACLIGIGDTFTAIYLVGMSIENLLQYDDFCGENENLWLTSPTCEMYGVISTFGTQLSLFTMTTFSVYAAKSSMKMRAPSKANNPFRVKLGLGCVTLIGFSLLVALLPINKQLQETYFYNGYVIENAQLFLGPQRNHKFQPILEVYYGKNSIPESDFNDANKIKENLKDMFRKPINELESAKDIKFNLLGFYGSSKSCIFKYFVDPQDPQKHFTWALLAINLVCFVVMATSYLSIHVYSVKGNSKGPVFGKLQWKITAIIITDFCCWLPFIIVCFLHYFTTMNATRLYPYFSIMVLPINSFINPLLYDSFFNKIPLQIFSIFSNWVSGHCCKAQSVGIEEKTDKEKSHADKEKQYTENDTGHCYRNRNVPEEIKPPAEETVQKVCELCGKKADTEETPKEEMPKEETPKEAMLEKGQEICVKNSGSEEIPAEKRIQKGYKRRGKKVNTNEISTEEIVQNKLQLLPKISNTDETPVEKVDKGYEIDIKNSDEENPQAEEIIQIRHEPDVKNVDETSC